jgi:hypothetical protein
LAFLLAGVALLGTSATAAAAPLTLRACSPDVAGRWATGLSGTAWSLINECPIGVKLIASKASSGAQKWLFPYTYRSAVTLTAAQATLQGSGGASVGARQGLSIGDSTIYPLNGEDVGTPTLYKWGTGAGLLPVPANATRLAIHGKCVAAQPCQPGPSLSASDLYVTFNDEQAPRFDVPSSYLPPGAHTWIDLLKVNGWNAGLRRVMWRATDFTTSGIAYATVQLNGGDPVVFDAGCGARAGLTPFYTDFCAEQLQRENYLDPNVDYLPDGLNTLTYTAYDMAGNSVDATIEFLYDNFPPPQPRDAVIADTTATGWRTENDFDVTWINDWDQVESEWESGIDLAYYQIVAADGSDGTNSVRVEESGISSLADLRVPYQGRWILEVQLRDRAGQYSDRVRIPLNYESFTLDAPNLAPIGWINRADLANGVSLEWSRPANSDRSVSGICGYSYSIDGSDGDAPDDVIDVEGDVTSARLPRLPEDGDHTLEMRGVTCSGLTGEVGGTALRVDLSKPIASLETPRGAWIGAGETLTIEARDDESGVDRVVYSVDGGPEVVVPGATAHLTLPGGTHSVSYYAFDVAGNRSTTHTDAVAADAEGPTGAIDVTDNSAPTLVTATVGDAQSGVASAWLEFEQIGGSSPTQFSRTFSAEPGTSKLTLSGRLPASEMAPGRYRIRIVASDHAGNRSVIAIRSDGSEATVVAPLLESPTIVTGFEEIVEAKVCKRSRGKRRCTTRRHRQLVSRRYVRYGRGAVLEGRISHANGEPLADARIRVVAIIEGTAQARLVGETQTDAGGAWSMTIPPGPNRSIEARYVGSETASSAAARATLLTHGAATLRATPRVVDDGQQFVLRGRVMTAGADVPAQGKRVTFEYRSRYGWREFPLSTRTDADGTYEVGDRLEGFARPTLFRLRARLDYEPGWPFATGHSPTVKLLVRPR